MRRILSLFVILPGLYAQQPQGGPQVPKPGQCLTQARRADIQVKIRRNRAGLIEAGLLKSKRSKAPPLFYPPLKTMSHSDSYHAYEAGNYVDHSPSGQVLDHNGGTKTYDGHWGTDYGIWPFSWAMMDALEVAVVACAPGTIVLKESNNPVQETPAKAAAPDL